MVLRPGHTFAHTLHPRYTKVYCKPYNTLGKACDRVCIRNYCLVYKFKAKKMAAVGGPHKRE